MSLFHAGNGTPGRSGSQYISGAIRRSCSRRPSRRYAGFGLHYPLPGLIMWRGNKISYQYQNYQTARYGEGEAQKEYHQHFAHAKDPADSGLAHEHEHMMITRAKPVYLPYPKAQVPPNSKPKWHWKSWHMPYTGTDIWRRELEYAEHIPTHLSANYTRPLCILSPQIQYNQLQSQYMNKVTITVCPFVFGHGKTLQKIVMDFYRACMSVRNIMDRQNVHLQYTMEYRLPTIEIEWLDGSTYQPPLMERMTVADLIQMVMEESFLTLDRLNAQKVKIPDVEYRNLGRWEELLSYKITKRSKMKQQEAVTTEADQAAAAAAAVKK